MSLARKISQLKNMSELQPDKNWEIKTKYELLSEIASQNRLMQAHKLDNAQKTDLFFWTFLSKLSPSLSKAIAGFLIIMMGSGVSLAAQASVPGEMLWPIKRSIEKVELSLTVSSVRETEVHIKHINKRLVEINKILDESNIKEEDANKKEKAIKQVVRHLEKDVTAADSSLKIAKEEKSPVEVVELVKKVTDATKEVSSVLSSKANDQDERIGAALVGAKEINEVVKKSAVNIAIEVHDELLVASSKKKSEANTSTSNLNTTGALSGNLSYETSTSSLIEDIVKSNYDNIDKKDMEAIVSMVKQIVNSEISNASSEISDVKQKAEGVNVKDLAQLEGSDAKDIDGLKTSQEDDQILENAKALVEEGFLRDAFNIIYQVKEKYQRADVVLEKIREAILKHGVVDPEVIDELNYQPEPINDNTLKASMTSPVIKSDELEAEKQ